MEPYILPPTALKEPPLDMALAAEEALKQAQAENAEAKAVMAGISQEQAEVLLTWIVHKTRQSLVTFEQQLRARYPVSALCPVGFFTSPDDVFGLCENGRALAAHQTEGLGLTTYTHDTTKLLPKTFSAQHSFSTVLIPVIGADGRALDKPYLVDTTFQQFFDPENPKDWGEKLLKTSEGKELADTLLRRGFVALDAANSQLYLETNSDEPIYDKALDALLGNSYLCEGEDHYRNWPLEFKQGLDVRTPSMVAAGQVPIPGTVKVRKTYGTVTSATNKLGL